STNNIDAIVIEKPVAEGIISSNSNLKIIDTIAFADDDGYGYAALKTSTKLIEIINNVIEDLKSTGKIDQLLIEASEATGE
ncbi:MAG: transporter substrate-binding domain-containing protein, partial [Erysipelotrichales bacterium]|nr:transporter substrate-binding domain-containing protein [Erysipelotrichales bacterium]